MSEAGGDEAKRGSVVGKVYIVGFGADAAGVSAHEKPYSKKFVVHTALALYAKMAYNIMTNDSI